jgi:hypothetical protein
MDRDTAATLARRMNAADPTLTATARFGADSWVVRTLDGTTYRDPADWKAPTYKNPRYVPQKVDDTWRVRDTHNRMLMSDEFGDVMAAEDACLSLNRPQVLPTEPSDTQLRLLCDISGQREDNPELRMRASEVRWLAREARRAKQLDELLVAIRAALAAVRSRTTPVHPNRGIDAAIVLLKDAPPVTPGVKQAELKEGL